MCQVSSIKINDVPVYRCVYVCVSSAGVINNFQEQTSITEKNMLLEGNKWSEVKSVMKDCFCFQHTTTVALTDMPRAES